MREESTFAKIKSPTVLFDHCAGTLHIILEFKWNSFSVCSFLINDKYHLITLHMGALLAMGHAMPTIVSIIPNNDVMML